MPQLAQDLPPNGAPLTDSDATSHAIRLEETEKDSCISDRLDSEMHHSQIDSICDNRRIARVRVICGLVVRTCNRDQPAPVYTDLQLMPPQLCTQCIDQVPLLLRTAGLGPVDARSVSTDSEGDQDVNAVASGAIPCISARLIGCAPPKLSRVDALDALLVLRLTRRSLALYA